MDKLSMLFHQHPIAFVLGGIIALTFFWGAMGTAQRRRNLKRAFFSKRSSALDIIGAEQMARVTDNLKPVIDTVRFLRKRCRILTLVIVLMAGVVLGADYFYHGDGMNIHILFIGAALAVLPNVYYTHRAKKKIVPLIAQQMGFDYDGKTDTVFRSLLDDEQEIRKKHGSSAIGSYRNSILLGDFERFSAEDCFSHPLICFQEVHTWIGLQDYDRDSHHDMRFNGLLVRITMPRPFDCPVLLREDMGNIGNRFSFSPKGFEPVTLEDPEFESFFEVFAPDQIKARRTLTPHFMETIKSVMQYYPAGRMTALMTDNHLYLAIFNYENLFEIGGILTSLESKRSVFGVMAQLELQKRVLRSFIA